MDRARVERRLFDVSARLSRAREELAVLDEQLAVFDDAADEARIRSLVSETPMANRDMQEARRHADAMARSRRALCESIGELERSQDKLLEQLVAGS